MTSTDNNTAIATNDKQDAVASKSIALKLALFPLRVLDYAAFFIFWVLLAIGSGAIRMPYASMGLDKRYDPRVRGGNALGRWYLARRSSAYRVCTGNYKLGSWSFSINYLQIPRFAIMIASLLVFGIAMFVMMLIPAMSVALGGRAGRRY